MKSPTAKHSIKLGIVGVLFTLTFGANTVLANQDTQPHSTISAWAVLEHNSRLIEGTTIGANLKTSSNKDVVSLYKMANDLFREAQKAHQSGNEATAKKLAVQSINTIYTADRVHYNLKSN